MNAEDFKAEVMRDWLDSNGLVKPRADWVNSGNGIFYSGLFMQLYNALCGADFNSELYDWFHDRVNACMIKPGLLARTPKVDSAEFGQEQFDNLLGVFVGEATFAYTYYNAIKSTHSISIIDYLVAHNGFYDTDGKLEMKDFLARFPAPLLLGHEVAYPTYSPFVFKLFEAASLLMPIDNADNSGINLNWSWHYGVKSCGLKLPKLSALTKLLPVSMRDQFAHTHPFVRAADYLASES